MWIGGAACAVVAIAGIGAVSRRPSAVDAAAVTARRAAMKMTISESGVLRARASATFRSPVEGRELEVTWLAPEGSQVRAGDLLVRLDTTALLFELDRARQAVREAEMQLAAARLERDQAEIAMQGVTGGAGALEIEESRMELRLLESRASRLKKEHEQLGPLLAKGYITRGEFDRSQSEADEAAARATLAARALQVLTERTQPANAETARLQVARRDAELLHLQPQLDSARAYATSLETAVERCSMRASAPGLVVYEENVSVVPHRKIRVGDRVTPSQPLVTLPNLGAMSVEASIREADLQLVRTGLRATAHLDAFPDVALPGVLTRIGSVARTGSGHDEESRFDVAVDIDAAAIPLRPAMNARIDIEIMRPPEILVPIAAVNTERGQPFCLVDSGGHVEARPVTLGRVSDTEVEIRTGIREGERVLLRPRG
jgi:multidrug resistance efflux pump